MKRGIVLWIVGWTLAAFGQAPQNRGCLLSNCHGSPGAERLMPDGTLRRLSVVADGLAHSAHKERACLECHADIDEIPHPAKLQPVRCESCHYESNPLGAPFTGQGEQYAESVHGQRAKAGDPNAPSCKSCHGTHDIRSPKERESRVHRTNLPTTCGECHEEEARDFRESRHGRDLANGNEDVPTCSACHGVHRILETRDPGSPVSRGRIAETCSECHEAVALAAKYDFSAARVKTYRDSFHGLAGKYGVTAVANCASCHGTHLILPQSDPRSTIHPANVSRTCGQDGCHPNARAEFAKGQVHLGVAAPKATVVRVVEIVYIAMIVGLVGGMAAHNLFDFRAQRILRKRGRHPIRREGDDA